MRNRYWVAVHLWVCGYDTRMAGQNDLLAFHPLPLRSFSIRRAPSGSLRIAVGTRKIEVAGDENTDGLKVRHFYRRRDIYVPLQDRDAEGSSSTRLSCWPGCRHQRLIGSLFAYSVFEVA
jgi:hypothetical protein